MVPSGSLTPSIDPTGFGLPAGTALRYERPVDPLRLLVPSYAVLDSDQNIFKGPHSWVLPGWPQLWIGLTTGEVTVRTRKRQPNVLGRAMLFGGTSCAMPTTSQGGVTIVIDLTPAGWARWFDKPADGLRDQIVPLEQLWSEERTSGLVARLHASDQGESVKSILDEFLLSTLPPPHHEEAFLNEIIMKIGESGSATVAETAVSLGVSLNTLLRVTKRYFGYPMKMLTRRTRFLRVISEMLMTTEPVDHGVTPPGYHDVSHFLRDAGEFLGMTPRRFLALQMPYLRAVLRARTMVIGAPLPLLDHITKP